MSESTFVSLGKATPKKNKKSHTPSSIQADTLFTFMPKLDFLLALIKTGMISPRFCTEDIKYLKIPKIKKVAYPMKCFCDINLHRLAEHLEWYGYYGVAFSKEWGMDNGIQPVQYINPDSYLRDDFTKAFSAALKYSGNENATYRKLTGYLLHDLMYLKPYDGKMKNRNTNKTCKKCFTDECEWRFVPDVTIEGYEQIYHDSDLLNDVFLNDASNSLQGKSSVSLKFNYCDIKYIIVKNSADFELLTTAITNLNLTDIEEKELVSKIIIWETAKGDF
ncbi:MAG: hypothetical protein IJK26_07515 [Clostridia bacterium]|nr:hypothetical protein [Clostridia bacterium]